MPQSKLSLLDLSEVVAGQIILGKISPNVVRTGTLSDPYRELQKLYKRKSPEPEDLIDFLGPEPYNLAVSRASESNSKINYVKLLEQAAGREQAAGELEKIVKRIRRGEEVNLSELAGVVDGIHHGQDTFIRLSDIKPDLTPYELSGWSPLDAHIGGLPKFGLTVIGGEPGVGKTRLAIKIIKHAAQLKKRIGYFSMEMMGAEVAAVAIDNDMTAKEKQFVWIDDHIWSPYEVDALTTQHADDFDLIVIDFAQLMLKSDTSEQAMAEVVMTLHNMTKRLKKPCVVLSQLNRSYNQTVPTMNRFRYSGVIEQLCKLGLIIVNPNEVINGDLNRPDEKNPLPAVPGWAYLVVVKRRFLDKKRSKSRGRGAIRAEWKDDGGWGDKSIWLPL